MNPGYQSHQKMKIWWALSLALGSAVLPASKSIISFFPKLIANLAPGQISIRYGAKGISYTPTSACSSGAHAIGEAFRLIRLGEQDAVIAGGAEAALTPLGLGGFIALKAVSSRN